MTQHVTLTLDAEAYAFLIAVGGKNHSAYINRLLKAEKRRKLAQAIWEANQEEADDVDYFAEISKWDEALADGLG